MISAAAGLREAPADATRWLPPEAPLEMPVQDLRRGRLAGTTPPADSIPISRRGRFGVYYVP